MIDDIYLFVCNERQQRYGNEQKLDTVRHDGRYVFHPFISFFDFSSDLFFFLHYNESWDDIHRWLSNYLYRYNCWENAQEKRKKMESFHSIWTRTSELMKSRTKFNIWKWIITEKQKINKRNEHITISERYMNL